MKRIIKYALLAGLVSSLGACDEKLDIPQHGSLNYDTYYQTDKQAEAAEGAMYLTMRDLEYNYVLTKNLLSDDFWTAGGQRNDNAELEMINEFTFSTENGNIQSLFQSYYSLIYKANVILGHVADDSAIKQRVRAEAKVLRAWAYFELISMWGNPPLVDHELSASEYSQPNGTTEALWGLVETDLTEAIESGCLMQKSNADDTSVWQVTKQFAQTLLGKAYLWQNKNSEAAKEFDKVIDSGLYRLYEGPYENIQAYSNKNHCESMFESNRVYNSSNVWDNWSMMGLMLHWRTEKLNMTSDFAATGYGFVTPRKTLYDEMVANEGADGYRLCSTIKTVDQMAALGITVKTGQQMLCEGLFMWKWRVLAESTPTDGYGFVYTNNPRWMRYAEVLLLGAEANLAAGNSSKADSYLNQVRARVGLTPKSGASLKDIQTEKRCELCGEGVRYQDIQRWGIAYDLMKDQSAVNPYLDSNGQVTYVTYNKDASKFGYKKGKHELLPYPGTEIRINPNIVQNPGW